MAGIKMMARGEISKLSKGVKGVKDEGEAAANRAGRAL
jgi:hypothetical protein